MFSPVCPITSTQHQHDTFPPLSSSFVHRKRIRSNTFSPLSPFSIHINKKYKNTSNNSEISINIYDNVDDTNNNTYIS